LSGRGEGVVAKEAEVVIFLIGGRNHPGIEVLIKEGKWRGIISRGRLDPFKAGVLFVAMATVSTGIALVAGHRSVNPFYAIAVGRVSIGAGTDDCRPENNGNDKSDERSQLIVTT
jgi:hypothetical protein